MDIRIKQINIENFKGIKKFVFMPSAGGAVVKAANGLGKTTIYDAFLWLLFGKDSTGRAQFEIRPIDVDGSPIGGLTLSVQAEVEIDGQQMILKKNHVEKIIKKQLRGFETLCWINDVPKKVSEFDEYVNSVIDESRFQMLADLTLFCGKMHWKERREILLDLAGKIKKPSGFKFIDNLNGRTIDEYRTVLMEQAKKYARELAEINPRIDELQKSISFYATNGQMSFVDESGKEKALESERQSILIQIKECDAARQMYMDTESSRSATIDKINELKIAIGERERKLVTLGFGRIFEEKNSIELAVENTKQNLRKLQSQSYDVNNDLVLQKRILNDTSAELDRVRQACRAIASGSVDCPTCKKPWPEAKQHELDKMVKSGTELNEKRKSIMSKIVEIENKKADISKAIAKTNIELQEREEYKKTKFAEFERAQKNFKVDPKSDAEWQELQKELSLLECKIGNSAQSELQTIESKRMDLNEKLQKCNEQLAGADNAKKTAARIVELENQEKKVAQDIATIEAELQEIKMYKRAESESIELAVNNRFKHVKFKMFDTLINGETTETCEPMLGGVPYSDCSTGQKIIIGVDVNKTLSKHYKAMVPLFIDNGESLTYKIDVDSQLIVLMAHPSFDRLTIAQL